MLAGNRIQIIIMKIPYKISINQLGVTKGFHEWPYKQGFQTQLQGKAKNLLTRQGVTVDNGGTHDIATLCIQRGPSGDHLGPSGDHLGPLGTIWGPSGKWIRWSYRFHYGIGPSGVRGSIRIVFRSTDARILRKVVVGKNQISKKSGKISKTGKTGIAW